MRRASPDLPLAAMTKVLLRIATGNEVEQTRIMKAYFHDSHRMGTSCRNEFCVMLDMVAVCAGCLAGDPLLGSI